MVSSVAVSGCCADDCAWPPCAGLGGVPLAATSSGRAISCVTSPAALSTHLHFIGRGLPRTCHFLRLNPARPNPTYGVARLGYVIAVTPLMIVVSPDVREREGPKVLFQTLCHRGKLDGWGEHCIQRRGGNNTSAGSFNQFFMLIWWTVFTLTIGPYELGKFFPLEALAIQRIRSPPIPPAPRISRRTESHSPTLFGID